MNTTNDFNIPPLPESLICCISYMYDDDFNYDIFIKKITLDIGITEKIFAIANSQYYSQGSASTDNLKQALLRIGANNLLKILTHEYYKSTFKNIDIDFFKLTDFNRHSSFVSHIAATLGGILHVKNINDLMIAGLFHDVGLLVRSYYQPEIMQEIVDICKKNKKDFYTIEKQKILHTHSFLGKEVALKWNLNERITYLIEHHHTPDSQRNTVDLELYRDLDILRLADTLAHKVKFGFQNYSRDTNINQILLDRLGLSKEIITQTVVETQKALSALVF